jgi:hypothetical protein
LLLDDNLIPAEVADIEHPCDPPLIHTLGRLSAGCFGVWARSSLAVPV